MRRERNLRDRRLGELGFGWRLGEPRWGPCRGRRCSLSPVLRMLPARSHAPPLLLPSLSHSHSLSSFASVSET